MVNVGGKPVTRRIAVAEAVVTVSRELFNLIAAGAAPKGDVLAAARIAGIQAAKRTSELIPLCHNIPLTNLQVDITALSSLPPGPHGGTEGGDSPCLIITATAEAEWITGVEMEALTAAAAAALTIYDMGKAVDRGMVIGPIRLLKKSGGKSGEWAAKD
jgi:cyclic pyranopterin phosphate synthase